VGEESDPSTNKNVVGTKKSKKCPANAKAPNQKRLKERDSDTHSWGDSQTREKGNHPGRAKKLRWRRGLGNERQRPNTKPGPLEVQLSDVKERIGYNRSEEKTTTEEEEKKEEEEADGTRSEKS